MSASNEFETAILALIFNNTALANLGDASGVQPSATDGSVYIGLHTGDPGEGGAQNTSEVDYTGYARVAVARTSGGWTVSGNKAENAAAITFDAREDDDTTTATHFSIGSAASGAGHLFFSGALTSPLAISQGISPSFAAGDLTVTAD